MDRRKNSRVVYRGHSHLAYGGSFQGLTGNQLKIIGIIGILLDNFGAVVIQGAILRGRNPGLYQAVAATARGHVWLIAGEVCRYSGRLAFPAAAFLTAEEFVNARDRLGYGLRMFLFALISEVPFDLAVYGTCFYPYYQNMLFTLSLGIAVMAVMEAVQSLPVQLGALAAGCAAAWVLQCDYSVLGILLIISMYWFRNNDTLRLVCGVGLSALESMGRYCISALSFIPIMLYNGRRGSLPLKYLFCVFYPVHLLVFWGIGAWIGKGV